MEENEIVKALRYCATTLPCSECPCKGEEDQCRRKNFVAAGLIEAYELEIQDLRKKVPDWIPVKERLPEIGVEVLTLDKWGHIRDRVYKSYTNGKPYFYPDGLEPGRDIKAWMPMLEEEKDEK